MDGPLTAVAVVLCLCSSALVGVFVHARLPTGVLTRGTADTLRRGVSIVALMAGLLLALLTANLKSGFDSADRAVQRFGAEVTELDGALRHVGPAAAPARALLFRYTARTMKDIWPDSSPQLGLDGTQASRLQGQLEAAILALPAGTPAQQEAASIARDAYQEMLHTRWSMDERTNLLTSPWLVPILVFWLMLTFVTLGLWAPRTPLVLGTLFLCAVALGGAVFLVVEYADPFAGVIIVSREPVQNALFAISE